MTTPESLPPELAALPSRSLGRHLVLATLGFCLLFTLATIGVRTWSTWQHNRAAMASELALIDRIFQSTLAKAIWEMDAESLDAQLESVAGAAPVGRIELTLLRAGRSPEIIVRGQPQVTSDHAPSVHRQLTYAPYAGTVETVGEVRLIGNESALWQRLSGELTGIVVTQVIQSLLLAGLIMLLFNRSVTVHVRAIARHLAKLSPATLDRPLQLNREARRRDELSLLEAGVNGLQAKLSSYLERQHQAELDLAAHRDRLAELVEERTAELREANGRLEAQSRSDPLTGLANRRAFDEVKDVEFRRAQRLGQPLSVLMCDVDFFKRYNDTYGHASGDDCLRTVAETLRDVFGRAGEVTARLGGEEFVVLLPGSDLGAARRSAERLQRCLADRALPHAGSDVSPYLTLSIGVASFDAETMDRFDLLLHRADQALYRAKSQGRNRIAE